MKRLAILFAAALVFACNEESKEEIKDYAIIQGKIINNGENTVTINSGHRFYSDTLSVSVDGTFSDTLRIDKGFYTITDEENYITVYLEKGNNIDLTYDRDDFVNTVKYSGDGAEANSYLIAKMKKEETITGGYDELFALEEDAFKAKLIEVKEAATKMINNAKGIPEEYKIKEKRNIQYSYLSNLNSYQDTHAYFIKNPDFKVSKEFSKEPEIEDYDNAADYKFSEAYREMVLNHYIEKTKELVVSDSLSEEMAFFKAMEPVAEPFVKNQLLYRLADAGVAFTDDLEVFYNAFMSGSTHETHKTLITEKYNRLKTVVKGHTSPKFVGYENYKGGTTSLDDLKGKYVYVDLWATWCGPCKVQIPFLKKVEKKYKGKNIEFVSISLDKAKDHDKWKKMVEDMELTGVQLFADNDFNSSFVKEYLVDAIPRFILIDPEGNIVTYNAPNPSSPALLELFDEQKI